MLRRRSLDLLFVLVSACFIPAAAQPQRFAGTWQARFKGEAFMTLKLEMRNTISGTLSGGHIEVNRDGDIIDASGGGRELPISNARIDGDTLWFDWKDGDDETTKLAMKLSGEGEAHLQFLDVPEGVKMKPIRLTRP